MAEAISDEPHREIEAGLRLDCANVRYKTDEFPRRNDLGIFPELWEYR